MNIFNNNRKTAYVFDGAMGTMLQAKGLPAGAMAEYMNDYPQTVLDIHMEYINAGADIISSNTFSANGVKMHNKDVFAEVFKGVSIAKQAAEQAKKDGKTVYVAADFGPTGKLMPPLGDFGFESAVNAFAKSVSAAEAAGADFIFFETFSDLYECKAAIISAKENCNLPIAVSVTFDENGRTLTGADAKTVALYLSALGVDALGVNCGLGPDLMLPIAADLAKYSGKPVIVNANAGLPKIDNNGNTYFDVPASRFYTFAKELCQKGIFAVGGCCGTTPEYIKQVSASIAQEERVIMPNPNRLAVCSGTKSYIFGTKTAVVGERLNPTGKKKLKEALKNGDMDYLCAEAFAQQAAGADILDVNVGIPDIDEVQVMPLVVLALQAVTDLPLQLDSANPKALHAAARVYNGIPIINSVSGKEDILNSVLPVAQKYGGMVVALLLDDIGIPATAKGRLAIADKIIEKSKEFNIDKSRFLFDALTMTVATDSESGNKTLECVKELTSRGLFTTLGVSNISFGMPNREIINASFLGAAIARGLTAAIINPASETAQTVLNEENPNPDFVYEYEGAEINITAKENAKLTLFDAVFYGMKAQAKEAAEELLQTKQPLEIIEEQLIPALNALGKGYENKTLFLPRLLGGAESAKAAFSAINQALGNGGQQQGKTVIMATVKGDIHDIGKNIVVTLLSNYGFRVIDMGKDVSPADILEKAKAEKADLVGLSALMTTTVPAMEETVALLHAQLPNIKVMVGGAVLTQEYATLMGADFYGTDAMSAVKFAQGI